MRLVLNAVNPPVTATYERTIPYQGYIVFDQEDEGPYGFQLTAGECMRLSRWLVDVADQIHRRE